MSNSPKDVQNYLDPKKIKKLLCVKELSTTYKKFKKNLQILPSVGGGRQFYDKMFSFKIMTNSYL